MQLNLLLVAGFAGYDKLFGQGKEFDEGVKDIESWFSELTLHDSITNVTALCTQCFILHKVNQKLTKCIEPPNNTNPFMEPKNSSRAKSTSGTTQPKNPPNNSLRKTPKRRIGASEQSKSIVKAPVKPFASFKKELEQEIKKRREHIFSDDHKAKGILNLGKNEQDICEKAISKIMVAHKKGLLQEELNQILTNINNLDATIRIFIKNGKPISINIWTKHAVRILGNTFKL